MRLFGNIRSGKPDHSYSSVHCAVLYPALCRRWENLFLELIQGLWSSRCFVVVILHQRLALVIESRGTPRQKNVEPPMSGPRPN